MQKIALSISITLLSIALLFVGVALVSPGLFKGLKGSEPKSEAAIFDDSFDFDSGNSKEDNQQPSAQILGASTEEEKPAPIQKRQTYQPQPIPTQSPQEVQQTQVQENKTAWDGYANKEAFCKDIADRVMQQPLPQIDQSNLPPELRVSPNLDGMWKDAYQSCMSQIRDY